MKPFRFVHIPKTGGLSVVKALGIAVGHRRLYNRSGDFTFGFVRNPLTRVVSAYYYLAQGGRSSSDQRWRDQYIAPYKDFRDFIENGLEYASINQLHFRPQVWWISRGDQVLVDWLGTTENLSSDFGRLAKYLGLDSCELPCLNQSRHDPVEAVFRDDDLRRVVKDIYKTDFRLWYWARENRPIGRRSLPCLSGLVQ